MDLDVDIGCMDLDMEWTWNGHGRGYQKWLDMENFSSPATHFSTFPASTQGDHRGSILNLSLNKVNSQYQSST